ncbi:phage scaffolding protein [Bavariicoccus seileri]|uniref:phage scaffolding protein n=1 Tax=Bavariicoccus seileri TaxID=549685 RepID=UPI0003B66B15|nr:phage scaffolding protein [Bavariicoccus seileri]
MKKEDLLALGIDEEVAKKVMALHGADQTKFNTRLATVEAERDNYKQTADGNSEALKAAQAKAVKYDELKPKYDQINSDYDKLKTSGQAAIDAEVAKVKRQSAIDSLVTSYNPKNKKSVMALIDVEVVKLEDGKLTGLKEQLDGLVKSDAYLFGSKSSYSPAGGQSPNTDLDLDKAIKEGNLTEYLKQKKEKEKE